MSNFIKESFLVFIFEMHLNQSFYVSPDWQIREYNLGIVAQNKKFFNIEKPNYINKQIQKKIERLTLHGLKIIQLKKDTFKHKYKYYK